MAAEADAQELQPLRRAEDEEETNLPGSPEGAEGASASKPKNLPTRNNSKKPPQDTPGIISLFRYATFNDTLILTVGTICAAIHGSSLPCIALIFGQMTSTFILLFRPDQIHSSPSENDFVNSAPYSMENKTYGAVWSDDYGEIKENMYRFSIYYLYVGIGAFIAASIQTLCWETTCERMVHRMRRALYAQMLRQDIGWYDQNESGDLTTKLSDDLERIREGMGIKFSMVLQYTATFCSGIAVGLYANWRLTLVVLSVSPILIGTSALTAKLNASGSAREQLRYVLAGGIAEEVLKNIRSVAAFGGQRKAVLSYEKALEEGQIVSRKNYRIIAASFSAVQFSTYATYGLAFWYGAQLVGSGVSTSGSVFTVFFSVMAATLSFGSALPFVAAVSTSLGIAGTVFAITDRVPEIDPYDEKGIKPAKAEGHIVYQDVTFRYPTRPEIKALRGFSVVITPGQTIAIVGSSGAGKSTVAALLLRFYNVSQGKILLDGRDIQSINLKWLRSQIGLVSQEPVLFGVSILDNIKYGYENVSFNDVVHAAKLSNAQDFISSMPQGYDTLVGASGAQLSGGQKQRIAIARALVRNPKILLLDEATSALDAQSEGEVQAALEQAMQGRTTIVIAHRLSTVRNADVIYTMEDGCIVEQGTYEDLMSKQALFHNLVQAQIFQDINKSNLHKDDKEISMSEEVKCKEHETSITSATTIPLTDAAQIKKKQEVESVSPEDADITRAFRMNSPEWFHIMLGFFGCVLNGLVTPMFAYFYTEVFATFTLSGAEFYEAASFWSLMFCVLGVTNAFAFSIYVTSLTSAAEILVMRMRLKAFENILNQAVGWFDMEANSPGRLITRLARDAPLIKSVTGLRAGIMFGYTVNLVAAIAIAFYFGWKLTLLLIIAVPILIVASHQQMMILRRTQRRDAKLMEEAGAVASESVHNIRTVQALGKESLFVNMYMEKMMEPYKVAKKHVYVYSFIFGFSQTVIYLMYAAAFGFGSYLIEIGEMKPVDVYRVFFALAYSSAVFGQNAAYFQDFAKAKMSLALMFQLIDQETDICLEAGIKPKLSGKVSFRNVHFQYPNRPDVTVLKDFSITVETGKTLALVGSSGCGKSTVVSLLERYYDPALGEVEVDDYDIKTLNLTYLREHIGFITQEPTLFDCTIWENIAYGIINKDQQTNDVAQLMPRIIEAARKANIHVFICSLPEGYNTRVGERGSLLSGGQKQRIAIARALIRDPKILLLDEATSALDAENEKIVQEALDEARQGRTCIVIAHRLSTIQNADSIAVIHQGSVVEQGSHEELMALKGQYYLLVKRQTSG